MTPEELFTAALGLGRQWRVSKCRFAGEPKRLELRLEHVPGEHFECPQCKALCGVHDTIERRWRHLNFFQYRCKLVAKVPRTWCRKDGVHQVQAPWAREGSGFTLMMEALTMLLSAEMPVDAMTEFCFWLGALEPFPSKTNNKPATRLIDNRPGPVCRENACYRSITSQQRRPGKRRL